MHRAIRGRRIHFAGSAADDIEPDKLRFFHKLVKHLARRTLEEGGGLIITLGSEPVHKSRNELPLIFDWTILEALVEYQRSNALDWPEMQGMPVVAVGLPNWRDRIPERRKHLWESVVSKNVELVQVKTGLSVGGVLREQQAALGDILVAAGGGPGVEHLAELYISNRKPVIPLDIQLKTKRQGAAERLSTLAMENPERFFAYKPPEQGTAAYSTLSLNGLPNVEEFDKKFFDFLLHLPKPRVFFARLMDKDMPEFDDVEKFFRNVADYIVIDAGYERFESKIEASREAFLNVETFEMIFGSSLVIADLTGLRTNCFTELGYALGLKKKVIMTAKEGTKLPFDLASFPCYFWSTEISDAQRKTSFQLFMRKNINRRAIVPPLASR
ncbi:MAG: hypothetical protein GH150_00255 [Hadesarchaea archaeon]|nr:hypothetical protein [Hadesarchaea archaeon]